MTVSVAALVVAEPQLFVKTARYRLLLSVAAAVNVYVPEVAPLIGVNVTPSGETCHWMLPLPFDEATNVTALFAHTAWLDGFVFTDSGESTVKEAAVVGVLPPALVKTAR